MRNKIILGVVVSLIVSYFLAYPVGNWFAGKYFGSGEFFFGPFRGFLDGFLLSYVFIASILTVLLTNKIKFGFYVVLPVLVFDVLTGSFNPQLWMDLVLLAAGLGLAWVILSLKRLKLKK